MKRLRSKLSDQNLTKTEKPKLRPTQISKIIENEYARRTGSGSVRVGKEKNTELANIQNTVQLCKRNSFQPFWFNRKRRHDLQCSRLAAISHLSSTGWRVFWTPTTTTPISRKFAVHFYMSNYHFICWSLEGFFHSVVGTESIAWYGRQLIAAHSKWPSQRSPINPIRLNRIFSGPLSQSDS